MGDAATEIAGIKIPSTDPVFLTVVGVHILLGLACTITGGRQFGRRWWKMMRRCRLPTVRAASAYSISRTRSISPRISRV